MAAEESPRELERRYEGFKVVDEGGDKIGKVDDLFIDEHGKPEYLGVKMGLLGTKSTLIPMEIVRIDEESKTMEVPGSKDHIKDAPTFSEDSEIDRGFENSVRQHFGLGDQDSPEDRGIYGAYPSGETGGEVREEDYTRQGEQAPESAREEGSHEARERPVSREIQETETFEEGGRTRVRRRIRREEEFVEDEPEDRGQQGV